MVRPASNFSFRALAYVAICLAALVYLGAANARGYIPFASPLSKSTEHTAQHFHK